MDTSLTEPCTALEYQAVRTAQFALKEPLKIRYFDLYYDFKPRKSTIFRESL